ncbi:MAG TPA: methylated-DNA--[protein]-cysteine S-methyltransferase [Rhizobiaceae bacterium]|nr:methylated-DNA--[protein]-cysteine S-methyltransferase [Rhizobiaceae bacterium]
MTNSSIGRHIFETALGWMAVTWSAEGLTRVWLPERERESVLRRVEKREANLPDAPLSPVIAAVVESLKSYAAGEEVDFSTVPLDLSGIDDFRLAIYDAAKALHYGETVTYGELAKRAGHPGLARETGAALGQNPLPIVVPCHRILAAGNKIGGFSAPGGSRTKEKMLAMEGVRVGPPPPAQASLPL